MTDIDRFTQWMKENNYTYRTFAPVVGLRHNTLWYMMKRGTMSDTFIVRFIKRYGCGLALMLFVDRLGPEPPAS